MNTPADDDRIDAIARGAFAPVGVPDDGRDGDGGGDGGDGADDDDAIDVARLMAYRAGELSADETAQIDAQLADDPEARALLRQLAEPVPPFLAAWGQRETRKALGAQRRRWIGPAVTVALAAAVALFVFVPRPDRAPDYRIDAVRGVQAEVRGDAPPVSGGRVDPDSVLVVALAPGADGPSAAPPARAFVETLDGRLSAAPVDAIVVGEGGALRFEAPVAELFGRSAEAFGPRVVWIAVGGEAAALAALDRQPAKAAREGAQDVRWLSVQVRYGEAPK